MEGVKKIVDTKYVMTYLECNKVNVLNDSSLNYRLVAI